MPRRPVRPTELCAFRLGDWYQGSESAAAGLEEQPEGDWQARVIAAAYGAYSAARTAWTIEHGENLLDDMLDRRAHRLAEWRQAVRDAAEMASIVCMRAEDSEETP
jgi:hypothetical protein